MKQYIIFLTILIHALATASDQDKPIVVFYDSCDLQNNHIMYQQDSDKEDLDTVLNYPFDIKAVIFKQKGQLKFYENGQLYYLNHDLECIEKGQPSYYDPQAQIFIKRNNKFRSKLLKKSLKKQKQEHINA
ncbi:hypothetical protein TTHERM_000657292 (macronuclear) [Tetrahymena thermophila SB210]|uniref:Transmembrane protein n=1 Tax=Tetrahymena thermophila (strain SB210) TaxID=312017 RepID=W7XGI8_TETTS|nr:hypothetical protein TTHERM_000657292 [Tetrahymena thermophila SB210]EWS72024.1 hypothetical protein TTHERM_000657292 [Tetrahymena thermophila SB210]|eukprot:XP_012655431.1 hypothetical protein TTHERM_000657292 [Tetrahymena thermophila SB210]